MPHQAAMTPPTSPESSPTSIATHTRPVTSEIIFPPLTPCDSKFIESMMKSASLDNVSDDIV